MLPAALPKRAVFRPFRQPALGRETNRPRNETPVVDLIYTPAGVPAFIIYASTDRELLNRSVKNIRRLFRTKRTYQSFRRSRELLPQEYTAIVRSLEFFSLFWLTWFYYITPIFRIAEIIYHDVRFNVKFISACTNFE